jgi:MFS family permease
VPWSARRVRGCLRSAAVAGGRSLARRAKAMAFMQTGWPASSLLAAVFARTLLDASDPASWRHLFMMSVAPAYCVALLILVFVKESPVWVENREFLRGNRTKTGLLQIFRSDLSRTTLIALAISILGMFWS